MLSKRFDWQFRIANPERIKNLLDPLNPIGKTSTKSVVINFTSSIAIAKLLNLKSNLSTSI